MFIAFQLLEIRGSFLLTSTINISLLPERRHYARLAAFFSSSSALSIAVRHHRAESQLIFTRGDEGAHHAAIVPCFTSIQNIQPEVIAASVRITPQVAEVLKQNKRLVVFCLSKSVCLDGIPHCQTPSTGIV